MPKQPAGRKAPSKPLPIAGGFARASPSVARYRRMRTSRPMQKETHSSDQTSAWRQQQTKMAKGLLRSPPRRQRLRSKLAAWHRLHSAPAAEDKKADNYRLAMAL